MYFFEPKLEKVFEQADLVIFDMNGLILDDEDIQLKAFNQVLVKFNIQIEEDFWINECIGHQELKNFAKIFSLNNVEKSSAELKELLRQQKSAYQKLILPNIKKIVRKGVLELIDYIKKETDKCLSLATSTTHRGLNIVLGPSGLNIRERFDFIICGEQITKSKPNPDIYLKVKKHFNIPAIRCLVLEDSSPGVNAAKNAKMLCFAIPSRYTQIQDFSRADFVISDLSREAKLL